MLSSAWFQCFFFSKLILGNKFSNSVLLKWSKLVIISTCRKYRASEKVVIVLSFAGYQIPIRLIFVDYLF